MGAAPPAVRRAFVVEINTGQAVHRLLFDCGEACLRDLSIAQIQAIDGLFFSHFHIDHVAGFDSFLRSNYNREDRPVRIWGPAGAAEIIQHRLRGVTWNLVADEPGVFIVPEIHPDRMVSKAFLTSQGFAVDHPRGEQPFAGCVVEAPDYRIEARLMAHGTPSVAYCLREHTRWNIDIDMLSRLGLRPGPWLKRLKSPKSDFPVTGVRRVIAKAGRQPCMQSWPGSLEAWPVQQRSRLYRSRVES